MDRSDRDLLEKAAVIHDASCPLCRKLYGKAEGRMQEVHSREVIEPIINILGWSPETREKLVDIASRHHTFSPDDSKVEVVLKEADALVNLSEA